MALSPLISHNELGDPIGQDDDPPPSLAMLPPMVPPSMPQLPALRPLITTPRMQREDYLQNAISSTPLGLTHGPAHGFWGNVRRISEGIANVAGDVLDPGAAERIPGSQLNREARVASGQRELAGLQAEDRADATAASEDSLRGAQTAASEEATREAPGKAASEEALQLAEANKDNQPDLAQAYAHAVSQAIKNGGDPATDPVVQHLADAITAIQKQPLPKNIEAKTLELPGGKQVAGKVDSQGNLLLEDGSPAPDGTKLYQQPNYAQLILPTKTATYIDQASGVPTEFQWDSKTQKYDIPVGQSATGAYGHEAAQAGAVERAGTELINTLEANKKDLGTLGSWVKKYGLNTPIADPKLAAIQAQLGSFAALNPAMHGARGLAAINHFVDLIGGLQQNPDASIAGIKAIMQTAHDINPGVSGGPTASTPPPGAKVRDYTTLRGGK